MNERLIRGDRRLFSAHRCFLALALSLGFPGCQGATTTTVTGEVSVDGKPLPLGIISFTPTDGKTSATISTGIDKGTFKASGVPLAKHKVAILSLLPSDRPRDKPLAPGETLPARYNTDTQLTAEITAAGANHLKFDLKSK